MNWQTDFDKAPNRVLAWHMGHGEHDPNLGYPLVITRDTENPRGADGASAWFTDSGTRVFSRDLTHWCEIETPKRKQA